MIYLINVERVCNHCRLNVIDVKRWGNLKKKLFKNVDKMCA